MRHLIDFGDLTRAEWESLYQRCSDIMDHPADFMDACRGRVMASLFYEPSTRTNFSFQTAMLRVGGTVFGFAAPKSTSTAKGETLKDTIKMVSGYADVVVMRNPKEGAAKAASLYSDVPVINAGDGGHMHPTQTTADLTTITRLRGKVDGLSVGLCGDLKNGRTVHSLIKALAKFEGIKFFLIAPRELAVPEYMRAFMREHGMWFTEVTGLEAVIPQLDVLYMTRIQRERFVDPLEYERCKGVYVLTRRKLDRAKKELLVMHPLPRVDEITVDVDGPAHRSGQPGAGKAGAGGNRRQAGVLQPQLHHPDRALPASPGEAERRRGLLRLLRQGTAVRGDNLRRTRGYHVLP